MDKQKDEILRSDKLAQELLSPQGDEETIDFGAKEIYTINRRNITIFNPSDKVMSVQLFLGLDDEGLINFYVDNYFSLMNK